MRLAVGSAFRNSRGRMTPYFDQLGALARRPGLDVRLIAAVGDCVDDTAWEIGERAARIGVPVEFAPCDHGKRVFGSTEEPERLEALTIVGNAILAAVRGDDDALLYVESDLLWDARVAEALAYEATGSHCEFDVVAPLVMAGELFYDVFAYRKDGERFSPFFPYHAGLAPRGITEVDSAGSCLAMRAEVARAVRMPPGGVLVGWCGAARAAGYRIGVAAGAVVRHPC